MEKSNSTLSNEVIPAAAGIGLRSRHYRDFQTGKPETAWIEAHSENLFAAGGLAYRVMGQIRSDYPLSLHGAVLAKAEAADPTVPTITNMLPRMTR